MCLCPILCVAIYLSFGLLFFFSTSLLFQFFVFRFSFFVVVIHRFRVAADVCCCTCRLNIRNVRTTEFVLLFSLLLMMFWGVWIATVPWIDWISWQHPYMPISYKHAAQVKTQISEVNSPKILGVRRKAKKPNCWKVMLPERWLSALKCKQ